MVAARGFDAEIPSGRYWSAEEAVRKDGAGEKYRIESQHAKADDAELASGEEVDIQGYDRSSNYRDSSYPDDWR